MKVHYHDFSEGKINQLESLTQQNIYMILKECLLNVIRHSKAQEAFLQIFEQEKGFRFVVEDDGVGLIPAWKERDWFVEYEKTSYNFSAQIQYRIQFERDNHYY
jgi:nitrate/nitrite-specific signal transduction histidine kinase